MITGTKYPRTVFIVSCDVSGTQLQRLKAWNGNLTFPGGMVYSWDGAEFHAPMNHWAVCPDCKFDTETGEWTPCELERDTIADLRNEIRWMQDIQNQLQDELYTAQELFASIGNPDGHTHRCRTCFLYYTPQPGQSEECPLGCDVPPPHIAP